MSSLYECTLERILSTFLYTFTDNYQSIELKEILIPPTPQAYILLTFLTKQEYSHCFTFEKITTVTVNEYFIILLPLLFY